MSDAAAFAVAFGRLHMVLVHFPIALLLAAAALAFWPRRRAEHAAASDWCLVLGLLGAVAAAGSGWVLAEVEPPGRAQAESLLWHRVGGLATLGAGLLAWLAGRVPVVPELRRAGLRRGALLAAAVLAGVTGHLGGELVHGAGYLTEPFAPRATPTATPAAPEAAVPEPAAPRVDFATQVAPIFAARCLECHGPAKVRGKLRLDAREHVFDPAREAAWVVRPGDPAASELLRRITLAADHEDVMPAKGEPLAPAQVELLRAWIAQGAEWPGG
jgi:uncharacterized membrane protein